MRTTTKNLRLGGLVLAMGMLAGCGGGGAGDPADLMEPAHRELEAMGLIHDRGADEYFDSLAALREQAWSDGNAELADLIIRAGLLSWKIPPLIERVTAMEYARVVEILEAADPETPYRQWDVEARQSAMEDALSDVPEAHRSFANTACMTMGYPLDNDGNPDLSVGRGGRVRNVPLPVYMIAQCIETNVNMIVSVVEPEGGRQQFGVWADMLEPSPEQRQYYVIKEASGGAVACNSLYLLDFSSGRFRRHTERYGGSFNDDGALTLGNSGGLFGSPIIAVVYMQDGEERMNAGRRPLSRVTVMTEEIWNATEDCF